MQRERDKILTEYDGKVNQYNDLRATVDALLTRLMPEGVHIHKIESRIKDKLKLEEKLKRKDKYSSLTDVTDILGFRIITLFEDEVDLVCNVLSKEFDVDTVNSVDLRSTKNPDQFGYLSVHYILRLSSNRAALPENQQFADLPFEVQVRSILQHAWAEIQHNFGYKEKSVIPSDYRRGFSRIAGMLELADEQFVKLRHKVEEYRRSLSEQELSAVAINRDSIEYFATNNPTLNTITQYIANKAECTVIDGLSPDELVSLTTYIGVKNLRDLEERLIKNSEILVDVAVSTLRSVHDIYYPSSTQLRFRTMGKNLPLLYLGYIEAYRKDGDLLPVMNHIGMEPKSEVPLASERIGSRIKVLLEKSKH